MKIERHRKAAGEEGVREKREVERERNELCQQQKRECLCSSGKLD